MSDPTKWNFMNAVFEVSDVRRETAPWGLRGFAVRDPDDNLIAISHKVHSPEGLPEYERLLEA